MAVSHRYHAREDVTEYLGPILNGQIIKDFDLDKNGYINLNQYTLYDNFGNGHQEYLHKWKNLFLYETYSFLMNSRWSKFAGSDVDRLQQEIQSKEKTMCWKGYFQFASNEGKFAQLKLFKQPPNVLSFAYKSKNYSKIYDEADRMEGAHFDLSHCREDDLIVISKFRINLEGQEDIKMVSGGIKFLREVMTKPGVMFGFVSRANTKADNFVEILVDGKHSKTFASSEDGESNIFTRYVYFFESLLTSLREFRALKALEWTRMAPALCYPTLMADYKVQCTDKYADTIDAAFHSLDAGPEMHPKEFVLDDEKQMHAMNNYLLKNHQKFNKSQA